MPRLPSSPWIALMLWAAVLSAPAYAQTTKKAGAEPTKKAAVAPTKKAEPEPATPDPKVAEFEKELTAVKELAAKLATDLEAAKKEAEAATKKAGEAEKAAAAAGKAADEAMKAIPKPEEKKPEEKPAEGKEPTPVELAQKAADAAATAAAEGKSKGDTAWVLVSSALVMLMVPGLALFYGGMVRRKNVLATMMQSMVALAVVGVYWIAVGYSLAFGPSVIGDASGFGGFIGWSWKLFFLQGVKVDEMLPAYGIPVYAHVLFQGMFAIITPALISGAIAERIRFGPYLIFTLLWVTFVYCPLAHWVWSFDFFYDVPLDINKGLGGTATGWLGKMGALDFAGGTVVHIAAGLAGLACILVLPRRLGYPAHAMHPNSMVLTLTGAGLLWFGWFGFNGGSALGSGTLATSAFGATQAAAAAAGLSWLLVEWLHKGKPTGLGLASGIVAGLVAVTPASGYVYITGGLIIGLIAGVVCYGAVLLKGVFKYDDSLDAFGVHGVGGFLGAVLTGVFCYAAVQPASADGTLAVLAREGRVAALKTEIAALPKSIEALEKEVAAKTEAYDKAKAENASDEEKQKPAKDDLAVAEFKLAGAKTSLEGDETELKKLTETMEAAKKDGKTAFSQLTTQIIAAGVSVLFAFGVSFVLAIVGRALGMAAATDVEKTGLDQAEHGETGFDLSPAEEFLIGGAPEPKSAKLPPGNQKRFEVVVEGIENGGLIKAWGEMCQPGRATDADFQAVYPYVTTVSGNRFRFRGGDPKALSVRLQNLFTKAMGGTPVRVRVEA